MPLSSRRADLVAIAALKKAREARQAAAVRPQKGERGDPGAPGLPGAPGQPGASVRGPKGDDGVGIVSIEVEQEHDDEATLVVLLSDHTTHRLKLALPRGAKGEGGKEIPGRDQSILQLRSFQRVPTDISVTEFLPDGKLRITFTDGSQLDSTNAASGGGTVAALVTRDTAVDTAAVDTDDVIRGTATLTVTLMSAASRSRVLHIKNLGAGVITVAPAGSDTIDGVGSFQIESQFSSAMLVPNATGWTVV